MKHPVFALLALSLFSLADCQNTPSNSTATTTDVAVVDDGPPPAGDIGALNGQVTAELITGRAVTRKLDSTYQQYIGVVRVMKSGWSALGEENQARVRNVHEKMMVLTVPYEEHRHCTDQLDSLSAHISAKSVGLEYAQQEYLTIRGQMRTAEAKLAKAKDVDMTALQREFEAVFSEANKAAGGK